MQKSLSIVALVSLAIATTACEVSDDDAGTEDVVAVDSACQAAASIPDPDELALTPRPDPHVEYVALNCSEGLVADTAVYEQLDADLDAIFAVDPSLRTFRVHDFQGLAKTVSVYPLEEADAQRMVAGEHTEFSCLTSTLGGRDVELVERPLGGHYVRVVFDGRYDRDTLSALYRGLDGVETASPPSLGGDGDQLAYDLHGSPRRVLFTFGGGDCPSGCTEHTYQLWTVDDAGQATFIATWRQGLSGVNEPAPPEIMDGHFDCRSR